MCPLSSVLSNIVRYAARFRWQTRSIQTNAFGPRESNSLVSILASICHAAVLIVGTPICHTVVLFCCRDAHANCADSKDASCSSARSVAPRSTLTASARFVSSFTRCVPTEADAVLLPTSALHIGSSSTRLSAPLGVVERNALHSQPRSRLTQRVLRLPAARGRLIGPQASFVLDHAW